MERIKSGRGDREWGRVGDRRKRREWEDILGRGDRESGRGENGEEIDQGEETENGEE